MYKPEGAVDTASCLEWGPQGLLLLTEVASLSEHFTFVFTLFNSSEIKATNHRAQFSEYERGWENTPLLNHASKVHEALIEKKIIVKFQ